MQSSNATDRCTKRVSKRNSNCTLATLYATCDLVLHNVCGFFDLLPAASLYLTQMSAANRPPMKEGCDPTSSGFLQDHPKLGNQFEEDTYVRACSTPG
jgi:hypothetical protein